jgi:ribosomal-protein-alanine N-acetyltransferase
MRLDEAPLFYEWATAPEVQPFWGERDHYDSFDGFLRHWHPHYFDGSQLDRGRCFAIESGGRPIGMISYSHVDVFNGSTEIDIIIGDPDCRDRGYGTDAIRAFLGFLFDTVGFHRVWLGTFDYNARAQRAYEKCGFVREGVMRKSDWVDDRWVDSVIYGILDHEFREGRAQSRPP